jgi:hypothetical protein
MMRPDLTATANRTLTAAEARAYLDAPATEAERAEVRALAEWFQRRYPTPLERLAYVRRAYARWRRTLGAAAR